MDYDWPGNVRELENCMERAVALCRLDEITVDDLPAKVQEHQSSQDRHRRPSRPGELITLDEMERRYVRQVLDAVGGNKTHAARILGIDRRSLYRRLEEPRHERKEEPKRRASIVAPPRAAAPTDPPHAVARRAPAGRALRAAGGHLARRELAGARSSRGDG